MALSVSSVNVAWVPNAYGRTPAGTRDDTQAESRKQADKPQTADQELTQQEKQQVAELRQIDREVHAHEAAHLAAAGGLATSGASYTYTYGPDGKRYATGGEVGIDTSAEDKPETNIQKGRRIQAAAMAPADPSPQDYQVARAGKALEAQGRADLAAEARAEQSDTGRQDVERTYTPTTETAMGSSLNTFA